MAKRKNEAEILPWERQKGESKQAYEAFAVYRDLGAERSQVKASQQLGKSRQLISRWSSQHNWVSRIDEYEREQNRLRRLANEKAIRDMNERQAKTAVNMQAKMLQVLSKMDLDGLKPNEIARVMEIGLKYERIARGADAVTQQSDEIRENKSSLSDTIIAAYKNRKEGGGTND